jgi:hypothetical protein
LLYEGIMVFPPGRRGSDDRPARAPSPSYRRTLRTGPKVLHRKYCLSHRGEEEHGPVCEERDRTADGEKCSDEAVGVIT